MRPEKFNEEKPTFFWREWLYGIAFAVCVVREIIILARGDAGSRELVSRTQLRELILQNRAFDADGPVAFENRLAL